LRRRKLWRCSQSPGRAFGFPVRGVNPHAWGRRGTMPLAAAARAGPLAQGRHTGGRRSAARPRLVGAGTHVANASVSCAVATLVSWLCPCR